MVKRIVGPMEVLYRTDLDARASGKATKGGSLLRVMKDLDPTVVCAAATRAALNRMSRPTKLTALARRIGEALEDEMRWHRWEKINKRQAEAVRKRVNQSRSPRQKHAALMGFARRWEQRANAEAWSAYRLVGIAGLHERYAAAFARSLPHVPPKDVYYRFTSMNGAIAFMFVETGALELMSDGLCSTKPAARFWKDFVRTWSAMLSAPVSQRTIKS